MVGKRGFEPPASASRSFVDLNSVMWGRTFLIVKCRLCLCLRISNVERNWSQLTTFREKLGTKVVFEIALLGNKMTPVLEI